MLQMASSALRAHLHTSRKIVNDLHTFLLRDFPDLCCDCCLQFTNCLRVVLMHIFLEIPPPINLWGVQVWWMRCPLDFTLPTDQSVFKSLSKPGQGVIWCVRVDPSCLNHCSSRSIPLRGPNDVQNFISTVWARSFSSSNQYDLMMPCFEMATHVAHFVEFWASLGRRRGIDRVGSAYTRLEPSLPSTPRMPFGAHFGKNIKILRKLTQMAKTLCKDHP